MVHLITENLKKKTGHIVVIFTLYHHVVRILRRKKMATGTFIHNSHTYKNLLIKKPSAVSTRKNIASLVDFAFLTEDCTFMAILKVPITPG